MNQLIFIASCKYIPFIKQYLNWKKVKISYCLIVYTEKEGLKWLKLPSYMNEKIF